MFGLNFFKDPVNRFAYEDKQTKRNWELFHQTREKKYKKRAQTHSAKRKAIGYQLQNPQTKINKTSINFSPRKSTKVRVGLSFKNSSNKKSK